MNDDIKIWAPKPYTSGNVNIKFSRPNGKEVSMVLDDSGGVIACFEGGEDKTIEVYGEYAGSIWAGMDNLKQALEWLEKE